jgi:hypothetical protein
MGEKDQQPVSSVDESIGKASGQAGASIDTQDTLAFRKRTGVKSMNESYPLERVAESHDRMMSGKT